MASRAKQGVLSIGLVVGGLVVGALYMMIIDPTITHIAILLPFTWGIAGGLAISALSNPRDNRIAAVIGLVLALLFAFTLQVMVSNPAPVESPPVLIDGSQGN